MLSRAMQLIQEQNFEAARLVLLDLIKEDPDDGEINFHCAESHDALGLEREAIPYYEKALTNGLAGELRERAFVQLGSSYRCIGKYQNSVDILEKGFAEFPENRALLAFLCMSLYNMDDHKRAVSILLDLLTDSTSDHWVLRYKRAIKFYTEDLDKTW